MIFVAEIGSNHKGVKALAYEMIRQFSQAGATICKFQLGHEKGKCEDKIQRMRYAPMEWVEDLAQWCDDFGVEFMASIWSQEGLDAARSVGMKRYKIAHQLWSYTNGYPDYIEELKKDKKETFASITDEALSYSENTLDDFNESDWFRAIYVSHNYPNYIFSYPEQFYGYSSHMHGIADALVAIARGACYIEKHVTLSKAEESIKDNAFALSPAEFADMVRLGKEIHRLI